MITILKKPADDKEIGKALKDHKDYIKVTIDIENEVVAIGGKYHADAENKLIKLNCKQQNIWGGGFDIITKNFETNALINIRPKDNPSPEILSEKIRNKFLKIARKYLAEYVK